MKTYWDFSEKERSELTREEVRALLKYELMSQGIINPEKPDFVEENEISIDRNVYYGIKFQGKYSHLEELNIAFRNLDDAETVSRMQFVVRDYDYSIGEAYSYVKSAQEICIETVKLCSENDVFLLKHQLDEMAEIRKANKKAKEDYEQAAKATEEACKDLWEDWSILQGHDLRYSKVLDTFGEYVEMCGDDDIAFKFLLKAFVISEIDKAANWFDNDRLLNLVKQGPDAPDGA